MTRKTWNYIYLIGLFLPLVIFLASNIVFYTGATSVHLLDIGDVLPNVYNMCGNLMPVSNLGAIILGCNLSDLLDLGCIPYIMAGVDLVFWLSVMHIVLDLFMVFSNLLHKWNEKTFGGK